MDDISLKILQILQDKARIPNVDVARHVGLAPSAVLERIRKLEKQGIIDGYEVRLNPEKLHKNLAAFLELFLADPVAGADTARTISELADVQEVHYLSGEDALFVKVRVASIRELHALIQEKIAVLSGVERIRTKIVLETYKESAKISLDAVSPEK